MRNEQNFKDLWDTIKYTNIHVTGVPEGEADNIFEELGIKNSPNLMKTLIYMSKNLEKLKIIKT